MRIPIMGDDLRYEYFSLFHGPWSDHESPSVMIEDTVPILVCIREMWFFSDNRKKCLWRIRKRKTSTI